MTQPIPVLLVGGSAREALRHDAQGAILSSHTSGAYCALDSGTVLLLHDMAFGLIPFGLGCPPPAGGWKCLPPGTVVHNKAAAATLRIGPVALCHAQAATPRSLRPWEMELPNSARLHQGLDHVVSHLNKTASHITPDDPAAWFGRNRAAVFDAAAPLRHAGGLWEAAIWEALRALLAHEERAQCAQAVTSLIGLGPGLTPLGDDVLCGLFAATHALAAAFPCPCLERLQKEAAPAALVALPGATTRQSIAFVTAAANGEAFGMLETLMAAIYAGSDREKAEALDTVMAVGHSSGSGLLLGVLCAAQAAAQALR